MGHLMRCRTLAISLQKLGWEPMFLGNGFSASGLADSEGKPFSTLDPALHGSNGLGTARAAEAVGAKMVIVDAYSYGMKDFLALWKGGRTLVVIDDLADRGLPVDVVINPNPLFPATRYREQGIPHCLVGSAFTLIRPEIRSLQGRPAKKAGQLLVSLGGGAVPEPFLPFLQVISGPEFDRICVMTPSSASDEALIKWAASQPGKHELCPDFGAFPGRLAEATAVISGGGTTLWEVYALGKPSLAIVWVDNQRQTLQVVESCRTGTVCDLRRGFEPDSSGDAWKGFLSTLNDAKMVERQRELIDGCGAERVAEYLQGLIR